MRTVPLAEAKAKLSGLIDDVLRRDERVTITRRGRPAAVLMSHEEAASPDATLEIMSDPDFYAEILRNRRVVVLPATADIVQRLPPETKRKVRAALAELQRGLDLGEPLERELTGMWRIRVGQLRIVAE